MEKDHVLNRDCSNNQKKKKKKNYVRAFGEWYY